MKLLHVADLHLDSPFVGMGKQHSALQQRLIQAPYQAWERCVSIAINQSVDAVVIVGDIYNSERQSIYAQRIFLEQLKRLHKANIPVIIGYGNHDYLDLERKPIRYLDNVHVFATKAVSAIDMTLKSGETARFYGFSYTKKWVSERMACMYPTRESEATYVVGCLHGAVGQQGNYAPFLVEELKKCDYDYWALGHIHQSQVLSEVPLIQYSGTIQGRHRHEVGDKGAWIVELSKGEPPRTQFVSLAPIVWQKAQIDCQSEWQATDVVQQIERVLSNYEAEAEVSQQSQLVTIELCQSHRLSLELQEQIRNGEVQEAISLPILSDTFVALASVELSSQLVVEPFDYDVTLKDSFEQAKLQLLNEDLYSHVMKDVFQHSVMKHWLDDVAKDTSMKENISQSAIQLMVQAIGFEGEEDFDAN